MAYQTLSSARVQDPVLTNIVQGYRQPEFIGQRFFPPVPVGARAGRVVEFGKEDFALYDTRRAPGGTILRTQSQYTNRSFLLYQDSIAEEVPIELFEEALNGEARVNLRLNGPRRAMRKIMLRLEKDIADQIQDPAKYETANTIALSGGDRWDTSTAKIPANIRAWREAVRAQIGVYPNVMGMGPLVLNFLAEDPLVRDKTKYVSSDSVTAQIIAAMFDFDQVHVGAPIAYNRVTGAMADIWGKNVWMGYVPTAAGTDRPRPEPNAARETPAFGYTYSLQNYPIALPERFDEDRAVYVYTVMAERSPEFVGMGPTGKVGSGFLATTVIS